MKKVHLTYNYLPQKDSERFWTIKDIHDGRGFGVYANNDISIGSSIGDSHYIIDNMAIAITELGKFHNHSENSNCEAIDIMYSMELIAKTNILAGDELTVNYSDYKRILNIEKPNKNWKKSVKKF